MGENDYGSEELGKHLGGEYDAEARERGRLFGRKGASWGPDPLAGVETTCEVCGSTVALSSTFQDEQGRVCVDCHAPVEARPPLELAVRSIWAVAVVSWFITLGLGGTVLLPGVEVGTLVGGVLVLGQALCLAGGAFLTIAVWREPARTPEGERRMWAERLQSAGGVALLVGALALTLALPELVSLVAA